MTGPAFPALHALFEEQYTELFAAGGEIGERIRALGHPAPGSHRDLAALTSIEEEAEVPVAELMQTRLAADPEIVAATAHDVLRAADEDDDDPSVDLATRRIAVHEKARWILRATLGLGGAQ